MTKIPEEEEPDHVFEDRSGIRGKVVVVLLAVLAVMTVVWLWDLGRRLLIDLPLDTAAARTEGTARPPDAFITLQANVARPCKREPGTIGGRQRLVLGYLPAADSTALTGLRSRCDQLDRVLADAFLLGAPNGTVVPLWAGRNRALQDLADQIGMPGGSALTVAQITASTRTDELADLLSAGPALDRMTGELAGFLRDQPLPGLCIDLTAHPDLDPRLLREALSRLSLAARRPGQLPPALCVIAGPEAGFWRDARLVNLLDLAVVKAFRETSSPLVAPAPPEWFDAEMAQVRALIPGPKLVVALGSFGQSWQSGQARSQRISYAETLARANRAGLSPRFDPARGSTAIRYLDADRRVNDIWLLDAATVANQLAGLAEDQSVAIWPLGYEDPALWSLLQPDPSGRGPAERLTGPVDLSHQVLTETGGPAVGAILPAVPGQRRVAAEASAVRITAQEYAPPAPAEPRASTRGPGAGRAGPGLRRPAEPGRC